MQTIQTIKKYQGRRKGNKAESPGAWAVLRERPLSSQADLVSSSVVKRDDLGPALQLGYANQTCLTKLPRQIMAISTLPAEAALHKNGKVLLRQTKVLLTIRTK